MQRFVCFILRPMKKTFTILSILIAFAGSVNSQNISLTGPTYSQNFDLLSNVAGSTTNNLSIPGWLMTETGGGIRDNEQYGADAGVSTTGDTYSYGAAGSTERALGQLRSGTLIPLFGAGFTNNTGSAISGLTIAYTGEQWRLGTATGRTDKMDFQYSLDATSLTTGTWIDVNALDFITPNTTAIAGAIDGNVTGNRTALTEIILGLSIPDGATFLIRWNDVDATSADDGLAIDDFSITPQSGVLPVVLSSFRAVKSANSTKVSWTSEQEINMRGYQLQRQVAGSNQWLTIDSVAAAGAAKTYHAYDRNPVAGINLYRLKMINSDGSFTYSDIASLQFTAAYELTLYPSPATNNLHIRAVGQALAKATVLIQNAAGQTIIQKAVVFNAQLATVDVSRLRTGMYTLIIVNEDLTKSSLRFIKD